MTNKTIAILAAISLASAFVLGRYSVNQPQVKLTTDVSESIIKDIDKDKHKATITVVEREPSGKTKTTTTVTEDTTTNQHIDTNIQAHQTEVITPQSKNLFNVSALVGADIRQFSAIYGISATKQVLGSLTVGVFGLSNGTLGASIGVNF